MQNLTDTPLRLCQICSVQMEHSQKCVKLLRIFSFYLDTLLIGDKKARYMPIHGTFLALTHIIQLSRLFRCSIIHIHIYQFAEISTLKSTSPLLPVVPNLFHTNANEIFPKNVSNCSRSFLLYLVHTLLIGDKRCCVTFQWTPPPYSDFPDFPAEPVSFVPAPRNQSSGPEWKALIRAPHIPGIL